MYMYTVLYVITCKSVLLHVMETSYTPDNGALSTYIYMYMYIHAHFEINKV